MPRDSRACHEIGSPSYIHHEPEMRSSEVCSFPSMASAVGMGILHARILWTASLIALAAPREYLSVGMATTGLCFYSSVHCFILEAYLDSNSW